MDRLQSKAQNRTHFRIYSAVQSKMKEIDALCQALREKKLKSKQAAFNYYYADFCAAKDLYGWEKVAKFINHETSDSLAVSAYKSMWKRAKKKVGQELGLPSKTTITEHRKTKQATTTNKYSNDAAFKEYVKACFNNESLAKRAINGKVSVSQIRAWNCPNQIRLGTTLSNYIMNNKKELA